MALSASELNELMDFAHRLADAARTEAVKLFRQNPEVEHKDGQWAFDPVTEADKAAERAMRALIEAHYPDHGIVGEEEGVKEGTSRLSWILDPIDGTRAYMAGIPQWGTLIGLRENGDVALGIIDQGYIGERWFAAPGLSGFQHGGSTRALKTSSCTDLADAILASTHPEVFRAGEEKASFKRAAEQVKLLRWGGDCYSYGLLALGTVDLVIEASLQSYDIQPIIPIIQQAGGVVTSWDGGSAAQGGQVIAAATPQLHAQAMAALNG